MKPRGDGSTNFVSNEEKKVQQAATEGKSSSSIFLFFFEFRWTGYFSRPKKNYEGEISWQALVGHWGGAVGRGGGIERK